MPAITYEIGGKNTKLRQSLQDSKAAVRDFRQNLKAQTAGMHADAVAGVGKGGIFAAVLGGNLVAKGIGMAAGAAKNLAVGVGDVVDASEQLGISVETLSRMEAVMEGAGVKIDTMRRGFTALNAAQSEVRNGSQDAINKFAEFGITAQDVMSLDLEHLFYRLADGMKGFATQGQASDAVLRMMGARSRGMVNVLQRGSEEMRAAMASVAGAAGSEQSKAVDDLVDSTQRGISAVKGFFINAAGSTVAAVKTMATEAQKVAAPPAGKPDPATKAAQDRRREALAQVALGKEDAALEKEKAANSERINSAQKDIADSMRSQFTFGEKYNAARTELLKAEEVYQKSLKGAPGTDSHAALAAREEAKAKFLELKQTAIERAAMPIAEQNRLQEQEKQQARDRKHAERTLNAQERDKLDRQFRRGEITKDARDHAIAALDAIKFGESPDTPEKQTAVHTRQIAKSVKVLAEEIKKI